MDLDLSPLSGWRVWYIPTSRRWVSKPPDGFWKPDCYSIAVFFHTRREAWEHAKKMARRLRLFAVLYKKNGEEETQRVDYRTPEVKCNALSSRTSGKSSSRTPATVSRKRTSQAPTHK